MAIRLNPFDGTWEWLPLSKSQMDSEYLKIDQTTPQDIINGAPNFLAGLDAGSTGQLGIDASGNLTTTGLATLGSIKSGILYPSADSTTAVQIRKADGTTNVLNVDTTNGNVGIGTTTPETALHIFGTSPQIKLQANGGSQNPGFSFIDVAGGGGGIQTYTNTGEIRIGSNSASYYSTLYSGNAEAIRILTSGNVGIGTTSPSEKLEVTGNLRLTSDNNVIKLGAAADASIYYDGTNLIIDPKVVGSGVVNLNGGNLTTTGDIEANDYTGTGNLTLPYTTFANQKGIIYKETSRFLHDFEYGLNEGGITPLGHNVFLGLGAGNFTMGATATETFHASYNTGIGAFSLSALTTGYYNVALGYKALYHGTTAANNFALGYQALLYLESGSNNIGIGRDAMQKAQSGSRNIGIGFGTLATDTSPSYNIAIGYYAGNLSANGSTVTEIDNSIIVGDNARTASTTSANEIVIGTSAIGKGANTVKIGNTSTTAMYLNNDNYKLVFGAGDDASIQFTGTSLDIQSDVVTATDELNLRGGTNGIDFLIGATEKMTLLADGLLVEDKIYFTQTDGNEYIDSLNDGYLDLAATTGIRLTSPLTRVTGDLYVGNNADADPAIVFDGDTNDGQITYKEDEDYFLLSSPLQIPYLAGAPATLTNGMIWMEADGLHLYYNNAEKVVAGS